MRKVWNPFTAALGILLILSVTYVGIVKGKEAQEKKEEENKEYIVQMGNVTSLSYQHEGVTFSFDKEGENWVYTEDAEFPLNEDKVSMIETDALTLEPVRVLEGADELSEYGLLEPKSWVQMTDDVGVTKKIGIGNPTGENYYASVEGETTVYTIDSSLQSDLSDDLYDFILLERLPYLSEEDIISVSVEKADGTSYVLEHESLSDEIRDAISSIYVSSCENYKVTEEELSQYGLEQPSIITYQYSEEKEETSEGDGETKREGTEVVLEVGAMDESGVYRFVKKSDSHAVNKILAETLDILLTKTAEDFT